MLYPVYDDNLNENEMFLKEIKMIFMTVAQWRTLYDATKLIHHWFNSSLLSIGSL